MKNILAIAFWIVVAGAAFGGLWSLYDSIVADKPRTEVAQNIGGNAIAYGTKSYITTVGAGSSGGSGIPSATTTRYFIHPEDTASSTIISSLEGGRDLRFRARMHASSTGAVLALSIQTSDDLIDWYAHDFTPANATNEGALNAANGNIWTWTPGITATSSIDTVFHGLAGTYYRVSLGGMTASSSIWVESQPIVPVPN